MKRSSKIESAKIASRTAILVACIAAVGGLAAGYFAMKTQGSSDEKTKITSLEARIQNLENDLNISNAAKVQAQNDLENLKQRVRDILGPKEDAIRRMSQSLERMKGDVGVSQDHRERLSEIVEQLDRIDNKVLGIVE